MIFTDTSAFYALASSGDQNHLKAKGQLGIWMEKGEALVTHNYILVESFALLHARLGIGAAKIFYREVHQICRVLWVSQSQHERASKSYVGQEGSRYSFVDSISFEIMKAHGIRRYFAFDDDFRRRGFEAVS